jgi:hypothetical protein
LFIRCVALVTGASLLVPLEMARRREAAAKRLTQA